MSPFQGFVVYIFHLPGLAPWAILFRPFRANVRCVVRCDLYPLNILKNQQFQQFGVEKCRIRDLSNSGKLD